MTLIVLGTFALLLILLGLRLPVAIAMFLSGALGLFLVGGWDSVATITKNAALSTLQSYELIAVPMFLLMAELVIISGVGKKLFSSVAVWIGRIRGGLAISTAIAGAGFGAISGSSTAAAATLASTSIPAMIEHGYNKQVAYGVVAISGTLAMLIPPSVAIILFGIIADVSIGKMLIAGIIPGLIITLVIIITVVVIGLINPKDLPAGETYTWREKLESLRVVGPVVFLFGCVTILIYAGVATPSEASAIGATGALIICIIYQGFRPRIIWLAAIKAAQTSAMILFIIMTAHVFSYFVALTQVSVSLVDFVNGLGMSDWGFILFLIVFYLILGFFMDQIAIMVLTVPVVLPIVIELGYDPIWFGILMIITAEVGMVTPPVGMNVFVVARYAGVPAERVFAGVWPHVIAHILAILLFAAFPSLILFLPRMME